MGKVRDLQLPDFFSADLENEGPMKCMCMVIIKGRGKQKIFSQVTTGTKMSRYVLYHWLQFSSSL
jgi:hypothetical protein